MNRIDNKVKWIAMNAMIAGLYAVLTLVLSPISYLEIQCRLSEVMVLLAFYNPKFIPGLVVGCFLANLASPLGMIDIVFGTISTLLVCLALNKSKNIWMSIVYAGIITGIVIGTELWYAYQLPLLINMLYVAIGEAIAILLGVIIFKAIENNKSAKRILEM